MSTVKINQAVKSRSGLIHSVRFVKNTRGFYRIRCKGFPTLTIRPYTTSFGKDTWDASMEGESKLVEEFVTARTPEQAYKKAMRVLWGI